MTPEEQSRQWHEDSEPTFVHLAHWRRAHPQATMAEIEEAVDAQMQTLRAHLLQEAAHAAPTPPSAESADAEKPRCPDCKVVLQARGKRERHVADAWWQNRLAQAHLSVLSPLWVRAFSPWISSWDWVLVA